MKSSIRYIHAITLSLLSTMTYAIPQESGNVISHGEIVRVITGLVVVLLIIAVLSWIVKRLHVVNLSSSKGFQSIASMTLGPKEKIILIRAGDRYLLMGVGSGVSMLHDFGDTLPPGFDNDNKTSFPDLLKSALGKSK